MNGAESLVRTLVGGGVNVCFSNPGTSEMHFVAALDRVDGMRCVLALFEGVATGAADGYARMAEKPAATLLHLGPGLANGLANLHNAMKAATPVVNIVGDHATYHRNYDSPLTSDIETAAKPFSGWVKTSPDARHVAEDGAAAIAAATTPPGQVATLILPGDTAWDEGSGPATVPAIPPRAQVSEPSRYSPPAPATGRIEAATIAQSLGALIPENAIVVDEGVSTGRGFFPATKNSHPHTWLQNMGGSIGIGMPLATGAAVACPDRPIVNIQADGSAMYTIQSLWTQAREQLNITTLLLNNRSYAILRHELANVGAQNVGRKALDMLDLGRPNLDFVSLARGMGVPGARVETMDEFNKSYAEGPATPGPYLIEAAT